MVVLPDDGSSVPEVRIAVQAAEWLYGGRRLGPLQGAALAHAQRVLDAALATLRGLAAEGFERILGSPEAGRVGAEGVVTRRGYFGPFSDEADRRHETS
jgi:hypothetical protein